MNLLRHNKVIPINDSDETEKLNELLNNENGKAFFKKNNDY